MHAFIAAVEVCQRQTVSKKLRPQEILLLGHKIKRSSTLRNILSGWQAAKVALQFDVQGDFVVKLER